MRILDRYCSVDAFWHVFEPLGEREQMASGRRQRTRVIIERVDDHLQHVCQIKHSRHRRPYHFLAHLLAGLVAYCHSPKKPSLHLDRALDCLAAG